MQIAGERVAAPDQDQAGVGEILRLDADRRADRVEIALEAGLRTDRARQAAGAHLLEEASGYPLLLQPAHRAGIGVGQHGLGSPFVDDALQPGRDRPECLLPGDALEAAAALRPHAPQRMRQPVGVVYPLQITVNLAAQRALRDGVIGVAPDVERPPAGSIYRDLPAAGVRAVMRAGAGHDADRRSLLIQREFCHHNGSINFWSVKLRSPPTSSDRLCCATSVAAKAAAVKLARAAPAWQDDAQYPENPDSDNVYTRITVQTIMQSAQTNRGNRYSICL